ncbi:MAG TPA: hypothetical protein VMT79_07115 [Candidatus Binatia bacterium]|nr:hypothetical protein [Candidatus Binatia bacterium]
MLAARAKTKRRLDIVGRVAIGDPGVIPLDGISRRGSPTDAVREIGWSRRHNPLLGAILVEARPGPDAAPSRRTP